MPDAPTEHLTSLLARVEGAEGPARQLDRALDEVLRVPWEGAEYWHSRSLADLPHFTASVDAMLALIERKLPEATFVLRRSTPTYWMRGDVPAGQWGVILNDDPLGWTVAPTPALALCAALLHALLNTESNHV